MKAGLKNTGLHSQIKPLKFRLPKFTILFALFSLALYFTFHFYTDSTQIDAITWAKFGAPVALDIYEGQYWGVITNSFLHVHPVHLILNLIGLVLFGSYLEQRITHFQFFLFGLLASFVTSSAQLALTGDPGIGLTGVNYAFFGYLLLRSAYDTPLTIKLKFILYIVMTGLVIYFLLANLFWKGNFGMISYFSGFLWGILFGAYFKYKHKWTLGLGIVLSLFISFLSLTYNPISSDYYLMLGNRMHDKGNLEKAKKYYEKCIALNPENKTANANLQVLEIDELSELAYEAQIRKKYKLAKKYYLRILTLDKNNLWARNNFRTLPD